MGSQGMSPDLPSPVMTTNLTMSPRLSVAAELFDPRSLYCTFSLAVSASCPLAVIYPALPLRT